LGARIAGGPSEVYAAHAVTRGRLNLCLTCRDVQPDAAGGLARATRELAQALGAEGHTVHLLTNSTADAFPDLTGVSVTPVFAASTSGRFGNPERDTASDNLRHAAAVHREVLRIHGRTAVDAVLAPLWRSEGVVCALDDRFPTVVSCMTSIQTTIDLDPPTRRIPDIDERLALERESLRRCRFLHGLTDAVLSKTISDHQLEPEATVVIGRGLRDRGVPRRQRTAPDGPVKVLFVGRIERRKGVDTLLEAARELVEAGLGVTFTLAGPNADPDYYDGLEREACRHPGLRQRVRFTGQVSDDALLALYAEADIVCVPSRYESHGIVLLEAMMSAKPILTCNAGGIDEVITPGHDALAVAPDDARALATALRRLVSEPELRDRLGAAARETFAVRFDARSVARAMQSFLAEVGALHRARVPAAQTVGEQLQELLTQVLRLDPPAAAKASRELLSLPRRTSEQSGVATERDQLRADRDQLRVARDQLRAELEQATATVQSQAAMLAVLQQHDETLRRIEAGGWWRLRGRLLPLLRLGERLRQSRQRRPAQARTSLPSVPVATGATNANAPSSPIGGAETTPIPLTGAAAVSSAAPASLAPAEK
jgi:glycosyltransferase involved in cell wall biosynthesis